jgi:hypothetical protein
MTTPAVPMAAGETGMKALIPGVSRGIFSSFLAIRLYFAPSQEQTRTDVGSVSLLARQLNPWSPAGVEAFLPKLHSLKRIESSAGGGLKPNTVPAF